MNPFIELLQISVGGRNALSRQLTVNEWDGILESARRQSLVGVLFDALSSLPQEQFPPKDIARRWASLAVKIGNRNLLLNARSAELSAIFASAGFNGTVLKGQGIAQYYPNPISRQPGDIDLWVDGGAGKVIAFLRSRYPVSNIQIHHADARIFDDVETEIHYRPSWSYVPSVDRKYVGWYASQWPRQIEKANEYGFCATTTEFNLVYLLMHMFRHVFIEGIGLRQFMDYYYVLISSDDGGRHRAAETVESLSLSGFAGAAMYVLREVFGMEGRYAFVPVNEKAGSLLLEEIMEGGNFGYFRSGGRPDAGKGRVVRGLHRSIRNLRLLSYYPMEVICYPFWMIRHWMWKKRNRYI